MSFGLGDCNDTQDNDSTMDTGTDTDIDFSNDIISLDEADSLLDSYTDEEQIEMFDLTAYDLADDDDESDIDIDESDIDVDEDDIDTKENDIDVDRNDDADEVSSEGSEGSDTTESDTTELEGQRDFDDWTEYLENIKHTPTHNSTLGTWAGVRGESVFIPKEPAALKVLHAVGLEGIPYKEALPCFDGVAAATLFLDEADMKDMGDDEQIAMANSTLASDIEEAEENNEEQELETIDHDIVKAALEDVLADGEDADEEVSAALLSGNIPAGFVWHHGIDADGNYTYQLIPTAIHKACMHRGSRSQSGTKR